MKSIYASTKISQEIWPDFIVHFKSSSTFASYRTDIVEIMEYFKKDFLEINKQDVEEYFHILQNKVKQEQIMPGTMAKKIRELHSFAEYISENRNKYGIRSEWKDEYYPYLKWVAGQEKYAKSVPVEDIDKLLKATEEDLMAYSIIVLLYRAGLSSTEIIELRAEDISIYENGIYVTIKNRKELCYLPEDAFAVLKLYMEKRENHFYLFYNQRKNQLNTMYISRMMRKYTKKAGIFSYSAENIRNTCGFNLFAYGASEKQVAMQLGVTDIQIKRYHNIAYRENIQREANSLVKVKVELPK